MATVREATFDLLRRLRMTTVFGNPGSTELPFLKDFPEDFRYVLGLQEATVLGMAEGFAQGEAAGRPGQLAHGPRPRQRDGGHDHGVAQQDPATWSPPGSKTGATGPWSRSSPGGSSNWRRPYVKRSFEPVRAADVPGEIRRAYHTAMQHPKGPGLRLDPDGRLGRGSRAADGPRRGPPHGPRPRSHRHGSRASSRRRETPPSWLGPASTGPAPSTTP